jgi:hypothetical protein
MITTLSAVELIGVDQDQEKQNFMFWTPFGHIVRGRTAMGPDRDADAKGKSQRWAGTFVQQVKQI